MEGSLGSRRCRKRTQVLDGMESGVSICPAGGALVECAPLLVRGGAVWQLVGLITRRSQVQILPPLPLRHCEYSHFGIAGGSRPACGTTWYYSATTHDQSRVYNHERPHQALNMRYPAE